MMTNLKRTWNDNPFDQWTEEELLSMEGQGICYGKGGGGSPPPPPAPAVQTQVNQAEFPTELKPFIEDIFGKAQGIQRQREAEGFQAFQGPLQAQFDPAQTVAFEAIENIPGATKPLFDEATSFARQATTAPTDPGEVAAFMNPFLRNVTDIEKREAERVSDIQEQQLAARAAQAGAFGGSRAAILESERERNLATLLGEVLIWLDRNLKKRNLSLLELFKNFPLFSEAFPLILPRELPLSSSQLLNHCLLSYWAWVLKLWVHWVKLAYRVPLVKLAAWSRRCPWVTKEEVLLVLCSKKHKTLMPLLLYRWPKVEIY